MDLERPRITTLEELSWETPRHATIRFQDEALATAEAGTFGMVWVPGVDEVPMGIGFTDEAGRVTLTVEGKGDCTKALLALEAGARIGVRGPYGTGFHLPEEPSTVVFVGGGTGIAPMARGAQAAIAAGHTVHIVSGARSQDFLLLHAHLEAQAEEGKLGYHPCTDDGSFGFHGFTTEKLRDLLAEADYVCACGPEPMMVKVTQMCQEAGIRSEASLERYMKCAVGICDACTVGDGLRLCVEGPVLDATTLAGVKEYGVSHRDAAGTPHPW